MTRTTELQNLWCDWLATSSRLMRSLHEQTVALTLRDVERVDRIQPELKSLLQQIHVIDDRATQSARKLAEELGTEPSLRGLVGSLTKDEAIVVRQLANKITVAARNVQKVMDKNQRLIHTELAYVNGTLALIAKASASAQGPYATTDRAAVLVNAVA